MSTIAHSKCARILVACAVAAEQAAIIEGLQLANKEAMVDVITCGVGPASAAAVTAISLTKTAYDLVISAGIGGGFATAPIGSVVVANAIIAADLGVEDHEQFITINELGFGHNQIIADTYMGEAIVRILEQENIASQLAPIITVTTGTGSTLSTERWTTLFPHVGAEGMEGFGVATAAELAHIPVLEIRAISNAVGPRDRNSWRIPEALLTLKETFYTIAPILDTIERRNEE